jgi:S1-C subfamily serine protease
MPFKVPIPYQREGFSLGSGFIINRQGYILTNAHVVHNATDIRVLMSDGQQGFPAKIIGMDRLTDTALLKMEADTLLTVCPLGNSDHLRTGEMVVAIGNPLGLRHTVTSGLISAKERISPGLNQKYMDFIQTDSAINPGSSGGPLMNLHGEVVGVNTALVAEAQSIGFAVPINTVKEVMPLLVLGKTERGWFGVRAVPLNAKEAATLNYEGEGGVLVVGVEEGSPADKAGIRKQDIILRLNGLPVRDFIAFRRKLLGLMPGRRIDLEVFRKGEVFEVSGKLVRKE